MKYLSYFEDIIADRRERTIRKFRKNMNIFPNNDINDISDFIIEHCSEWINNPSTLKRSMSIYKDIIFSSKPVKRYSVHNANYYNLIIDNDTRWKEFPKRTKSFIGSINHSPGFAGATFYMIPFDGAKFGVTPTSDIISSFRNGFLEQLGIVNKKYIFNPDSFFSELSYIFQKNKFELSDTNFRIFKKQINELHNIEIKFGRYF